MMKVQMQVYVVGAQYYDILDDKTGAVNRYTSIFTLEPCEDEKPDRVGYRPAKVRAVTSDVVRALAGLQLPAELMCDCEFRTNAKGESKIYVHRIHRPVSAAAPSAASGSSAAGRSAA